MTEHAPGGRAAPARRLPTFLLMIVVLLGGSGLLANRFTSAIVVQTEPADSPGAQPGFIPTAGSDAVGQRPVHMVGQVVTGDSVGLYSGTTTAACDTPKIRDFLATNPQPAHAWAGALRIAPAEIDSFLDTLTVLTLRTDTVVTNHGFRKGVANPFPSVLQAGTAVLVDAEGLPRVRCICGNPLQTPVPLENVRYAGRPWSGFEPESVTVIGRAPREVMEFVVMNHKSDQVVTRPRATSGEADESVSEEVEKAVRTRYEYNEGRDDSDREASTGGDPAVAAAVDPSGRATGNDHSGITAYRQRSSGGSGPPPGAGASRPAALSSKAPAPAGPSSGSPSSTPPPANPSPAPPSTTPPANRS